ncbi:MAG: hypothetical protein RLZZ555_1277 [Pseudomonadota bacterium]|jgi:peptidoglycan L-alanyl-D-glutamate endopeptidase CwlK
MKLEEMIATVQRELGVAADGKAGPQTWSAIHQRIVGAAAQGLAAAPAASPDEIDRVDERSEKAIATLLPEVRPYARALVHKAAARGIQIQVISGHRSYAEQDELYAQGRSKPGPIVTRARGGHSNHNFGIAFDIGVFEGRRYLDESPKYQAVGVLGAEIGLEWGGNWKDLVDQPHFQLRPAWAANLSGRELLAALRQRVADGNPVFA